MIRFGTPLMGSAILAAMTLTTVAPSTAQSIVNSSNVQVISPPASAAPADLYNQTTMTGFPEQQNLLLANPLGLDIGTRVLYSSFSGTLSPRTIPAGVPI